MVNMEANVNKMEEQLKLWDAKLDVLVAKTKVAGAQAKIDHRQRIDVIKAKRAAAQMKLDEFKAAGNEKWDSFKAGIEAAWKDLELAFKGND
jgi:hypothetical protein